MSKYTKLKDKEIYKYDSKEGFTLYDPLSYRYNGFDIKSLYKHYLDKKTLLKRELIYFDRLEKWLEENDITFNGDTLYKLLDDMFENTRVFKKNNDYHYVEFNNEGYISKYQIINGDVIDCDKTDIPQDIDLGYYKLVNDSIIKDKEREELLWIY